MYLLGDLLLYILVAYWRFALQENASAIFYVVVLLSDNVKKNQNMQWKVVLQEYSAAHCGKQRKSIEDTLAVMMLQEKFRSYCYMVLSLNTHSQGFSSRSVWHIWSMWQDLQKFSTFSTSLQHLWNKLTTECHVKTPFSLPCLFLTVICSQGIDSRLWTESGWQSLAVLLSVERCFFRPAPWIPLFFYCLPCFCILREILFFPHEKKWPKIWTMAEFNSATRC